MRIEASRLAQGHPELEDAIVRARKLLRRKALTGAVTSMVPIPGVDWLVDASLITRVIPQINAEFGLTPAQISRLDPGRQERLQKAIATVGAMMIGRLVTKEVVLQVLRRAGVRMTSKQAVKYVPVAGQLAAAGLGYAALRYLGEQHIRDCVQVCLDSELASELPPLTRLSGSVGRRMQGHWLGRSADGE